MKKTFILLILNIITVCVAFAQSQAFVVELNNGLSDIFQVSQEIKILNNTETDSLSLWNKGEHINSYANKDVKRIRFNEEQALTDSVERAALVALYNATNGPNWNNNTNWCSDKPISEWAGVQVRGNTKELWLHYDRNISGELPIEITNLKNFVYIDFNGDNLYGNIPPTIGRLNQLYTLDLSSNNLSGPIPNSICDMIHLRNLGLYRNALNGPIPKNIGKIERLYSLYIGENKLSGTIPDEICNLKELHYIILSSNNLEGEIPYRIFELPSLEALNLRNNNLSGSIPNNIPENSLLRTINLSLNNFTGTIPNNFGNLKQIKELDLSCNQLEGNIPECLGNLTSLATLELWKNSLDGEIPKSFENLKQLISTREDGSIVFTLSTYWNKLSGNIPKLFLDNKGWDNEWVKIIARNNYKLNDFYIPAPAFHVTSLEGKTLDSKEIYSRNKYTALFHWGTYCGFAKSFLPLVQTLYNRYKNHGFDIIGFTAYEEYDIVRKYIEDNNIKWANFISTKDNMMNYTSSVVGTGYGYPEGFTPEISLVDSNGQIVFSSALNNYREVAKFLNEQLGKGDGDCYISTDYSQDGLVTKIQEASVGNGINLVLMGEAFTDKDISSGNYMSIMHSAMQQFFCEQPYKALQNYFNVYVVNAVSPNASYFSDSQHAIGENTEKVFEYAKKALGENPERIMVGVIYNQELVSTPERSHTKFWLNDGSFIAYMKDGVSSTINHEMGGHGFAQLLDEYVESENEGVSLPDAQKERLDEEWEIYGVGANVDYHNNPSEVKWASFLNDPRYGAEQLGVFEGANLYSYGCYRPSENSMMRYNDSHFNAPSREAIYKRIMKYADTSWQYNREKFVEFDLNTFKSTNINSRAILSPSTRKQTPKKVTPEGLPPSIINGSWKD